MHRSEVPARAASVPLVSERERLATVALHAAQATAGVAGSDAGPAGLYCTRVGSAVLDGVAVIAEREGRYSVELSLVALPVPLYPLAATVRERLTSAAVAAGLGAQLGTIDIQFTDVVENAASFLVPR